MSADTRSRARWNAELNALKEAAEEERRRLIAEGMARHATVVAEQEARRAAMPDPMPGRLADGTRVWLHYEPLRWERHP